ncbi:expressed unknown protein [Seminavis robusta]|uniref:Uncharacterized protein n=1 Tax=Seminavis robusta TaxID=568900 RepID=A0A9N8E2P9_9STRA|nr:expressed unknown protein [Seminavis robusta]|eukprot:Sro594_g172500.1 n/a (531) ;mRNA; r:38324-40080
MKSRLHSVLFFATALLIPSLVLLYNSWQARFQETDRSLQEDSSILEAYGGKTYEPNATADNDPTPADLPMLQAYGGIPNLNRFPLKLCEGDCDVDSDCDVGLLCFQRIAFTGVPGCQGGETFAANTDFCISIATENPTGSPTTKSPTFGPTGSPTIDTSISKLPTGSPAIDTTMSPTTTTESPTVATDVTNPPSEAPALNASTASPTIIQPTSNKPTTPPSAKPSNTLPPTINSTSRSPTIAPSTQPSATPTTAVPTTSSPTRAPTVEPTPLPPFSIAPTTIDRPLAEVVGNNGDPASSFPLQLCQGDCDRDGECAWGLYCHGRSEPDSPIPGCTLEDGSGVGNNDFCLRLPSILPGAFRLRLYWEEGYEWQNSTRESFWCATNSFNGWPGTGRCWYGDQVEECLSNQTFLARCDGTGLEPWQQAFLFLPVNDDEVLIQSAAVADQRCWRRSRRELFLTECDPNDPMQRWIASNGTAFFDEDNRFEISQAGFNSQCISNDHHPKPGEVIELHSCEALRAPDSQTALWTKY